MMHTQGRLKGKPPSLHFHDFHHSEQHQSTTTIQVQLNNRILRSNLIAKVSTPRFSNTDYIHEELKHRQDSRKCIMIEQLMIYHHWSLGKMYVYWITKLGNRNQQQSQVDVQNPDHTSFNSQMDHQKDETVSK